MAKLKSSQKVFSLDQRKAFVDAANPHQWLRTADTLHSQALVLWRNRGQGKITMIGVGKPSITWDDTNRATFLLAAFAMENMLKAFLIYENHSFIADGYLKGIATHSLWGLAERASLVPYKVRDRWVFDALSEGNESWARYPCGRDADDIQHEGQFTIRLWTKYCSMMDNYTKKMKKMLENGWDGPFGYYGRWSFSD